MPLNIDLHTHSEMPLLGDGTAQSKVRQGVTLDVVGEEPVELGDSERLLRATRSTKVASRRDCRSRPGRQ